MVLGAVLLVPLCLAGTVCRAASTDTESTPPAEASTQQQKTLQERLGGIGQSIEATHARLEEDILEQVIRLDDFFGNEEKGGTQKSEYELRWRNGLRADDGGSFRIESALRAHLRLPRISERLRLFITGENQNDQSNSTLPQDPGNPGFDRTTQPTARVVNAEFRYGVLHTPVDDLFLGAGIRITLPLEPFVRSRYQHTHNFSKYSLARVAETLFVKYGKGVGETTELYLERLLGEKSVLRHASSATVSQEFSGLEWGSELSLAQELSPRSGVTYLGGVYGTTYPSTVISNYRVLTRYRRNFLRDWLFYEVEPEVSWPRDQNGDHEVRFALTLRLEMVFKKAEK